MQTPDTTDSQLLELLQENCQRSYAELGEHVGLSISAVKERIRKLQEQHIIKSYTAVTNPKAIGYDICAFVSVLLGELAQENIFVERINTMHEIQECHHIAGDYSYLLKIRARNVEHLEEVLKAIKTVKGIQRTNTQIVLSSTKETTFLSCKNQR